MTAGTIEGDRSDADVPRRSKVAVIVPLTVISLTVLVVAWSAWPTLSPVRTVQVTQAIFDRTDEPRDAVVTGDRHAGAGRVGTAVQAPGWLEAEPYYVAAAALADGVVEHIEALEGDRVAAGQVVARLVSIDAELKLSSAEAELSVAQAELALAEAELRAAETDWNEPVERERAVEAGRAALAESEAEVAQLPSMIAAARATLVQYEEELSRAERSRAGQAATELEVIVARQRVEAQRATVESLEAMRPLLAARSERLRADLRAAERNLALRIDERRRLDSARAALDKAHAAVLRARAARDEAALELDRMVIRAPIDGYVQRRLKAPGDKVVRMMDDMHSGHVALLYDPERLQVRVDVPLADASHLFVGQRCEVVVEVLPDRVFEGEVLRITHEADLQKNTLQAKVRVVEPSPLLRPEMLTRVRFLPRGESAQQGAATPASGPVRVRVPSDTLHAHHGGVQVWTVTSRRGDRGVARAVHVQRESDSAGWTVVSGPVQPGALIVVDADGLREGQRVRFASRGGEGTR
ncbi:MAG: efflux RND transporter periplasmic adaptor subunit [Phycisphaeraceae bacterium]|nr:efflux RND transporter periplasmic adaptor subunit [Phycisphaeraceae bacterium]